MRIKLTWAEFVGLATKKLSEEMDTQLDSPTGEDFVRTVTYEGEIRVWEFPEFVYFTSKERRREATKEPNT